MWFVEFARNDQMSPRVKVARVVVIDRCKIMVSQGQRNRKPDDTAWLSATVATRWWGGACDSAEAWCCKTTLKSGFARNAHVAEAKLRNSTTVIGVRPGPSGAVVS